ncbi:ABC transporter ATP-binding protein [Aquabacter sp. CN5-332]|uniref:ABC transporter ATP-binding protein n=1 Tax=Aquabacter sp. CN5-332 TaxID=3156608 RepID=UPI0032B3B5D8
MALLEINGVTKRFRGLVALDDVSLSVEAGEVIGLIGPNGAGKTTLVNVISGVYRPDAGHLAFDGARIDGLRPDLIARRGIARTFQIVQPFPRMTALENVAAAALFAGGAASLEEARHRAGEAMEFCGLSQEAHKRASTLTLASRKRLELAKSLAQRPKLLLLDEVNAGLNAAEIDHAIALIQAIAARGITVLVIEHLMKVVTRVSSRIVVLHQGRLIADGGVAEVMADRNVVEAYLGQGYAQRMREAAS